MSKRTVPGAPTGEPLLSVDLLSVVLGGFPLCYLVHLKRVSRAWASAVRRVATRPGRAAEIARLPARFATYDSPDDAYAQFNTSRRGYKPRHGHVAKLLRRVQKLYAPRFPVNRYADLVSGVLKNCLPHAWESPFDTNIQSYVEDGSGRVFLFCDQYGLNTDALNALALWLVLAGFDVHAFAKTYVGPDESAPGYSGAHYRWTIVGLVFDGLS